MSTVVGINFGGSVSSVAIITKEGLADCIANEDGERQIANAISYSGDEEYIGVPAKQQLVRNASNTILGFRNMLGKSYSELKDVKPLYNSCPIVEHEGKPAFKVTVNDAEKTLTVNEVATKFLQYLVGIASDFLGRKINAAVFSIPSDWSQSQKDALSACASACGVKVLQYITEPAAAAVAYRLSYPISPNSPSAVQIDKNVVVLDVGAASTIATVLAVRDAIYTPLADVCDNTVGGDQFDQALIGFFSKEFTKKTKVNLQSHRGQMKLRLASEISKRTLSASNSANCSVDSMEEGMDYSGSINRMRFDLLSSKVYEQIVATVQKALEKADVDALRINEVILVGGSTRLPTLADRVSQIFPESTTITSQIDPDEVVAKGCALQAQVMQNFTLVDAEKSGSKAPHSSKPVGVVITAPSGHPASVDGKLFITIIPENTPLPARRIVEIPLKESSSGNVLSLAVWEGAHEVKVDKSAPNGSSKPASADDEDDEDDEDEETRTALIKPTTALAQVNVAVKGKESVRLTVVIYENGKGEVIGQQNGDGSEESKASF